MTTKLSTESLRAMLAGITPGEWNADKVPCDSGKAFVFVGEQYASERKDIADLHSWHGKKQMRENARAIAALPDLLAEVIALRTELADLRALQVNGFDPLAAARDYPRLEAENEALRDALALAASALDSGLNSGDAVSAGNDMDNALMQARAALGDQS